MTIPHRTLFRHVQRKTGLWVPETEFAGWYPCCGETCTHSNCDPSTVSNEITVELAGFQDTIVCNDCESLNASFVLLCLSEAYWRLFDLDICNYHGLEFSVKYLSNHYWMYLYLYSSTLENCVVWRKDVGTDKPNCNSWSQESIPFYTSFACGCQPMGCQPTANVTF